MVPALQHLRWGRVADPREWLKLVGRLAFEGSPAREGSRTGIVGEPSIIGMLPERTVALSLESNTLSNQRAFLGR